MLSAACARRGIASVRCWRNVAFTCFFFFNDTATTEIYTLSLHDALPISLRDYFRDIGRMVLAAEGQWYRYAPSYVSDRKSGSAGMERPIWYAVFGVKKKIHIPDSSSGRLNHVIHLTMSKQHNNPH